MGIIVDEQVADSMGDRPVEYIIELDISVVYVSPFSTLLRHSRHSNKTPLQCVISFTCST